MQLICKCVEIQYYSLVGAKSVVELTGVHVSWLDLDNIHALRSGDIIIEIVSLERGIWKETGLNHK